MTTNNNLSSLTSEKTELRRDVGLFGGISVLAGIMIGSGIFYIGAIVLQRSGMSLGLALLVWLIGGLVTLMSGICFAELGAMMPKAGGYYVYLREAYGERVAFMCGFANFCLSSSGSIAALAVAFAAAISSFVPLGEITQKVIAISAILLLTGVNVCGIRFGSLVQNIFMILKMLPILLILVCGLVMGNESPDLTYFPGEMPSIPELCSMVGFAVIATLWAYEGWTNLNNIAEEIKNPKRNIPLALIGSITGVALLYVLFNYAVYRVLPYDTIVNLVNGGDFYLGTHAANELFGSAGMIIVGTAMILAIFNSLNGCIMVFPRMYYAMARDGALFKSFAKLHPVSKTPINAQIASAIMAIILVSSRTLSELTSLRTHEPRRRRRHDLPRHDLLLGDRAAPQVSDARTPLPRLALSLPRDHHLLRHDRPHRQHGHEGSGHRRPGPTGAALRSRSLRALLQEAARRPRKSIVIGESSWPL